MKVGLEKCTLLIIRHGKCKMLEGIELPNQEKIRMFGKK